MLNSFSHDTHMPCLVLVVNHKSRLDLCWLFLEAPLSHTEYHLTSSYFIGLCYGYHNQLGKTFKGLGVSNRSPKQANLVR